MKKNLLSMLCGLFICSLGFAVPKYWVGPVNGNWNSSANWSLSSGGPGSAGVPDATDSVIFSGNAAVNIDISPTIAALTVGQSGIPSTTVLFTSQATVLTILRNLLVQQSSSLTDSTSASVPFNMLFSGATSAKGQVNGSWIFSGGTALANPLTQGSFFTAEAGSAVAIGNNNNIGAGLLFRTVSGVVVSTPSTLGFSKYASCVFDNATQVNIPNANWAQGNYVSIGGIPDYSAPSTIVINGNTSKVVHLATTPAYGDFTANLNTLSQELSLDFPNGTTIAGNLTITATNNNNLVLLSNTAPSSTLTVSYPAGSSLGGGDFTLGGATSKVAVSKPTLASPAINFVFAVAGNFTQTAGNLSLQDNDISAGTVTMDLKSSIVQTGGTFFTNSAATGGIDKFVVSMSGPLYLQRPSGIQNSGQGIRLSSGAIQSGQNQVTLKLAQNLRLGVNFVLLPETGIVLNTPVAVGKMQFVKGVIHSTTTNLLSVTNPAVDAIPGSADSSYVDGPLVRATNSTGQYLMPVGAPPVSTGGNLTVYNLVHYPAPFYVIPSTATASSYSGTYYRTNYTDSLNYTAPLQGISKGKYWDVSRISGSDASIRLVLREAVAGATFDKAIVVAHYEGSSWVAANGTALTPGTVSSGSVTSKVLSSFSPFTFGIVSGTDIPLALTFTGFTARKTGLSATLDWSVESAPARFEIMRSNNGTSYTSIGTMNASTLKKTYQFIDNNILGGTNYYRIRSIEANGQTGLSVVNAVVNATDGLAITYLAPNRVKQFAKLFVNTAKAGKLDLIVTDISGRSWKRMTIDVTGGNVEKSIDFSNLPGGVYQITGTMNGLVTPGIRFVKE